MEPVDNREKVEQLVLTLQAALQARSVYGEAHKLSSVAVTAARTRLQEATQGRTEITVGVVGDKIVYDGKPLFRLGRSIESLAATLTKAAIAKFMMRRDTGGDEIGVFLGILDRFKSSIDGKVGAVDTSRLRNIVIEWTVAEDGEGAAGTDEALRACAADYTEGVDLLGDIARSAGEGRPIDAQAANAFIGKILERLLANKYPLLIAASLKRHDEYSFVHSLNVAVFSVAQGQNLGLSTPLLADIGMAGFLHDSGKLAVAGQILGKKDKLSSEEFDRMRLHPVDGAKILVRTPDLHPLIAVAAFEHHLRYDGTGYPRKAFGDSLHLPSMLVAIADVYDALRSNRPYREGMLPEKAYEEMRGMSGTHFCPDLLDAFFNYMGVYPPGTLVELTDGHIAIVVEENAGENRRPKVELWHLKGAGRLRQPRLVDLAEKLPGGGYERSIRRSVSPSEGYPLPPKYRVD